MVVECETHMRIGLGGSAGILVGNRNGHAEMGPKEASANCEVEPLCLALP